MAAGAPFMARALEAILRTDFTAFIAKTHGVVSPGAA